MLPLLVIALLQCPDGTPPPCGAPARGAAVQPGSIAVFPFANRSPDSSDAYLAEALPEQIIGRLARVAALRVKSATAVNAQWRRTPDAMAAARALRVEWFVTGSIRRSGGQLAVTAELVRAASGDGAWSAPFRRGDDNVAVVEEQIAESVAVAIVGRLAPAQAAALRRTAARHPEAYRLYLYGRTLLARRVIEDMATAAEAFTQAVRLDPQFAAGWARLANARSLQAQWGGAGTLTPDSLLVLAAAAAARAMAIDSSLAEAWMAQGGVAFNLGDLAASHAAFERSLALDSANADTWHSAAYIFSVDLLHHAPTARRMYRRALALDPDLRNSWRHLALVERDEGNLALAEALLDTALSFGAWGPGYTERSWVRYLRGNPEGALADLAAATRMGPLVGSIVVAPANPDPEVLRAVYRIPLGDSAAAVRLFAERSGAAATGERAMLAMALGRRAVALDELEQLRGLRALPLNASRLLAAEPRCGAGPCSPSLRTWTAINDPLFAPLRSEPRFQRLLAETRPRAPWLP